MLEEVHVSKGRHTELDHCVKSDVDHLQVVLGKRSCQVQFVVQNVVVQVESWVENVTLGG